MVNTAELEEYLNAKSCNEDDICTVMGGGEITDIKQESGEMKKAINLPVQVNGRDLTYTPGKMALAKLQGEWGPETNDWKGKKFQVKFNVMIVKGKEKKVISPSPLKA